MKPEYVNTDLELRSRSEFQGLIDVLSQKLTMLYNGREGRNYIATFEVGWVPTSQHTADKIANRFCAIIENLPPKHRLTWNKCLSRHLDLGFHSGTGKKLAIATMHAITIQRVAKLKIAIAVSVYPLH